LHQPALKDNDKAFSCKAIVTRCVILPSQPVIFVKLQQLVIKVNAGAPGLDLYLLFYGSL
jgi:hypothetical protein